MREQLRIVEAALRDIGLPWHRKPGGKHPKFIVEAYGDVIKVPVAFSPRDRYTAGVNTAKQIRRAVDEAKCRAAEGVAVIDDNAGVSP